MRVAADALGRDAHAVMRAERDHGDVDSAARVPALAAVVLRDLFQRLQFVSNILRRAACAIWRSP